MDDDGEISLKGLIKRIKESREKRFHWKAGIDHATNVKKHQKEAILLYEKYCPDHRKHECEENYDKFCGDYKLKAHITYDQFVNSWRIALQPFRQCSQPLINNCPFCGLFLEKPKAEENTDE